MSNPIITENLYHACCDVELLGYNREQMLKSFVASKYYYWYKHDLYYYLTQLRFRLAKVFMKGTTKTKDNYNIPIGMFSAIIVDYVLLTDILQQPLETIVKEYPVSTFTNYGRQNRYGRYNAMLEAFTQDHNINH